MRNDLIDLMAPRMALPVDASVAAASVFKTRHSRKTGRFIPKDESEGTPNQKDKPVKTAADGAIEHDPDFPVKEGFRRVETQAERKAVAETHGVVIPPGWRNVQVSIDPNAPGLRARGTDAKGRVQPRYSEEHRAAASAKKFARIKQLDSDVGVLDTALERDAATDPTAGAVLLMRRMGLRPGSTEDTRADRAAYGATTLEARHLKFGGRTVTLDFDSKKGGHTRLTTSDPEVYRVLKAHAEGKGPNDRLFDTSDERTNDYIDEHIPGYTNKDLRTYLATGLARVLVSKTPPPATAEAARQARKAVATSVSEALGNTPEEAYKSYIAPEVWDASGWAA